MLSPLGLPWCLCLSPLGEAKMRDTGAQTTELPRLASFRKWQRSKREAYTREGRRKKQREGERERETAKINSESLAQEEGQVSAFTLHSYSNSIFVPSS